MAPRHSLETRMSSTRSINLLLTSALLTAATLLCGCEYNSDDVTARAIRLNMTPELVGLATSQDDNTNNDFIVRNLNARMVVDDWNRFWLIDKPSSLSPYPIVPTTRDP